ncbi:MAG TPA: hypothetical protein VN700_17640 [Vicinamibacterales bacterium]|nr:hypothetical protein [Vicinamibacterales bacterium]
MRSRWIPATLAVLTIALGSVGLAAATDREMARYRDVTLPAGTLLSVTLDSYVASDTSRIEGPVRAHVRQPVLVNGVVAIPAGSALVGHITHVERGGRVSGRANVAFRFDSLSPARTNEHHAIRTSVVSRTAKSTKGRDVKTIAIPAAGGAIVGAIVGGKKGAAIGAAAGGGGGTAVAMSTRGPEVRLGRGYAATVRLLSPVTVRVPVNR